MQHLGRPCDFESLGQKWTAARQTRRVLIEFADWARPQIPDPVKSVLENIDAVTAKDAETLRRLTVQDKDEEARASTEGREPEYMRPLYQPMANEMLRYAQERKDAWQDINSPAVLSLMTSLKGQAYLFFLLLRRGHPDITEAKVDDILDDLPGAEIARVLDTTSGRGKRPQPKNDAAPAA